MRLHTFMVCFLGLVSMVSISSVSASETPKSSCSALTATGNSEYPPFLWRDATHVRALHGVNRIIVDELSQRINIPIELMHVGPWSRAQTEVRNGRVDLMAGAFYTNERADYMDYFTPVMLHTSSVVWQHKEKPFRFERKEDLETKWGVTVINNSFGQAFDQYAHYNLNLLAVASLSQALQMLASNRVDYVLYEKNPASAYVNKLGLIDVLIPVQPYVSREGLYLTLSKLSPCNNTETKRKIAASLQDMQQEGFMAQALNKGIQEWEALGHVGLALP